MEPVHVPKGQEKKIQRALLQYRDERNRGIVTEGLISAGRSDLIGNGAQCLVSGSTRDSKPAKNYFKKYIKKQGS